MGLQTGLAKPLRPFQRNSLWARGSTLSAYDTTVLADTPAAFWPLNEPSGTIAADVTGNGWTGAYVNGPVLAQTGIGDGETAVAFSAASFEIMRTSAIVLTATNNWSIECWAKLPNLTVQDGMFLINGSINGFGIGIGDGAGGTGLKLTGLYGNVGWLPTNYTFADTNWHQVVLVRSAGTATAYVDGAAVTVTAGGASVPQTPTLETTVAGNNNGSGSYLHFANATIAKPAVYNAVLSPTRIAAHFAAG